MADEIKVGQSLLLWFLGIWGAGGVWVGTLEFRTQNLKARLEDEVNSLYKRLDALNSERGKDQETLERRVGSLQSHISLLQSNIQEMKTDIAREYMSKADVEKSLDRVILQLQGVNQGLQDLTVEVARVVKPARRTTNGPR